MFAEEGLALTAEEARRDMGRPSSTTCARCSPTRPSRRAGPRSKGAPASEADVERLYQRLEPAMKAAAAKSSRLIPGAAEVAAQLRALGVRIGSGTGYTREMMADILPAAAAQGYAPEVVVCAGETPSGRPAPLMTWKALIALDAWPARACIKVDDAPVGIEEGRLAGCWTVGLSGLRQRRRAGPRNLPRPGARRAARAARAAEAALRAAGADFVIEDVSALLPVVHEIAGRIAAG